MSNDGFSLQFNDGEKDIILGEQSTSSLASRIREVSETPADGLLLTQMKKNSRSKRNKKRQDERHNKKRKKTGPLGDDVEIYTSDGFMTQGEFKKKIEQEDEFDKMIEFMFVDGDLVDPDEVDGEDIVRTQKNAYKDRAKDTNTFKKEFNEELTLLYEALQVATNMANGVEGQYTATAKSRTRGVSKYSNDLLNNYNSLLSTRLNIIKEITNIKKTAIDLKIKDDKNKQDDGGAAASVTQVASSYLNSFFGNRNGYLSSLAGQDGGANETLNTGMISDDHFDNVVSNVLANNEPSEVNTGIIDQQRTNDIFDEFLNERLEDEGNPLRREGGTRNIETENQNVRVVVYRNSKDNSEWEFVAIDGEGKEVVDYDLPDVMHIGKMTFREKFASDERGRSYEIIEY